MIKNESRVQLKCPHSKERTHFTKESKLIQGHHIVNYLFKSIRNLPPWALFDATLDGIRFVQKHRTGPSFSLHPACLMWVATYLWASWEKFNQAFNAIVESVARIIRSRSMQRETRSFHFPSLSLGSWDWTMVSKKKIKYQIHIAQLLNTSVFKLLCTSVVYIIPILLNVSPDVQGDIYKPAI